MNTAAQMPKDNGITFDELISRYELSNRSENKSEKTIKWYGEILRSVSTHLKAKGYHNGSSSLNIDTAREYILYLRNRRKFEGHPYTPTQDTTLSPRTLQCHTRGLKAFSTWLYLNEYTAENRLKNMKLPKAPAKLKEPLTPEEIKKISLSINKDSPAGSRNHAMFSIALDSGPRASGLAGIRLGQVNLKDGYIKVMGKGGKERIVPIGKYVQMIVWNYINNVRTKLPNTDCDNLFLSSDGKPITANTIKLVFSRLAKSSGVKRLHAHLCRHTFAINYLLNGGDIFTLKEILGHTSLEMVNHYLHFTSSQIMTQHHKYSPMDRQQDLEKEDRNK